MKKRKTKKQKGASVVTGVACYRRDQWPLLLAVSVDASDLEPTYDEWLKMADRSFHRLQSTGLSLEKIDIDVEELISWCKANGREVDGAARAEFTSSKVQEKYTGQQSDADKA
jgi:hypothetical protein